ncbi:MAG: hypothetical protein ACO2ZL_07730 [Flavobacteriales bacterium]|jgi:hypothetical protein
MKSLPIPLAALSLLLVPFVASLFTDEVQWSGLDYLIMGVMLLAVGSGIQWVLQKFQNRRNRLIGVGLVVLLFLLVWAELAVGVFGTPFAGS